MLWEYRFCRWQLSDRLLISLNYSLSANKTDTSRQTNPTKTRSPLCGRRTVSVVFVVLAVCLRISHLLLLQTLLHTQICWKGKPVLTFLIKKLHSACAASCLQIVFRGGTFSRKNLIGQHLCSAILLFLIYEENVYIVRVFVKSILLVVYKWL